MAKRGPDGIATVADTTVRSLEMAEDVLILAGVALGGLVLGLVVGRWWAVLTPC